ncbi:MAG: hypothetical protein LBL67_00355 [Coriobacteriales bacterium]|jgi:DNA-damage-inducible protein J|nr:hypothetical protein [Coriobacteriales bacterium]
MATVQIATRVSERQNRIFRATTKRLGTTPADALRMFIATFNENQGFPYEVRLSVKPEVEPFASEEEATAFAWNLSQQVLNEAR